MRCSSLLFLLLALLTSSTNAQSQTNTDQIEPLRPQLELKADQDEDDDLELSEPDDQPNNTLDGDLDSGFDEEEEPITPQRLSDDRIRDNWPKHSLATISLSLAQNGRVPEDRSGLLQGFGRVGSVSDTVKVFAWEAPSIHYQPLYFEDVVLERYGQTLPDYRQSVRSAIHFGTAFTGLGLQLLETPPRSCDSPLGYCRPGDCVPQTTQRHFFGALSLR